MIIAVIFASPLRYFPSFQLHIPAPFPVLTVVYRLSTTWSKNRFVHFTASCIYHPTLHRQRPNSDREVILPCSVFLKKKLQTSIPKMMQIQSLLKFSLLTEHENPLFVLRREWTVNKAAISHSLQAFERLSGPDKDEPLMYEMWILSDFVSKFMHLKRTLYSFTRQQGFHSEKYLNIIHRRRGIFRHIHRSFLNEDVFFYSS